MDLQYLLWLQELRVHAGDTVTNLMCFLTEFGPRYSIPVLLFVYWSVRKEHGIPALFSLTLSGVLNGLVKACVCAYRPWIRDPDIVPPPQAKATATGYSFPSGHTATATSSYGMLAWLNRKRRIIACLLILLVLVIGFSRNFLSVHTPQDVLCALFIGVCSIVMASLAGAWEKKKSGRDWILLLVSAGGVALSILFVSLKSYPMDYGNGKFLVNPAGMTVDAWKDGGKYLGFLLGWCLEKHFVNFTVPSCLRWKIIRFIPGFLFFQYGSGPLETICFQLTGSHAGAFAANFLTFFFLIFLYPAIFTAIEKRSGKLGNPEKWSILHIGQKPVCRKTKTDMLNPVSRI